MLITELGLTPAEQSRLANAMFQLEAARRSGINQNATTAYITRTNEPTKGVTFDAAEAINSREG